VPTSSTVRHHVIIGQINGLYGVHGGLKIFSYTNPRENIFSYNPWLIKLNSSWVEVAACKGKTRGKGLSAVLEGIEDREAARRLMGVDIAVYRDELPPLADGEYYWCDLINLEVFEQSGKKLGIVVEIQETGANDVLVVQGEQGEQRILIPLLIDKVIKHIDTANGRMQIDWDPDFQ